MSGARWVHSVFAHLETEILNSISLVDNEDDILAEHDYPRRSNWRKLSQQAQEGFRIKNFFFIPMHAACRLIGCHARGIDCQALVRYTSV